MLSLNKIYAGKLLTAEQAVELIPAQGSICLGYGTSQPPGLMHAIGKLGRTGNIKKMRIYYMHSYQAAYEAFFCSDELLEIFEPVPISGLTEYDRKILTYGHETGRKLISVLPSNFSEVPRLFESGEIPLDACLLTVSPMDKGGNLSLGTSNAYNLAAARSAKKVIVEVNRNMPRVFGESSLHISEIDAVIEYDSPVHEIAFRKPSEADERISEYIAELIPNGATIQLGVGGVPNAICEQLRNKHDLGIHSELLCPGMVELIKLGVINGSRKELNRGKHVFTLCMGNRDTYDYINDNSSMEGYPVSYVNDFKVISQFSNLISVNSAVQVDFFGQANAEFIKGRTFSGVGGQNDFVRGAVASPGGKSFIALNSTARNGTISRIVPCVDNAATDLRMDTHYIVTEYGIANMKGKTTTERTKALIAIAHPKFRDELEKVARDQLYI
ncbi:MAG: 4-hydroxybutyrate--acetyl-CoA CoA transferase [Lentisphaerae bacterium]|nr:4-hydroxybutyrate--acetyl-CoA CoA transferase [Lentisphaerota bacterium]MCP4101760.1 4-hydroxybutyrate--acetyl-CoA CoA transferase [Lentisphaerota bacterium]